MGVPAGGGRGSRRSFGALLVALLALGLATQVAILREQLARDPFARTPILDAGVYWDWAGDVARGRLVGATPFLSAPLYPYGLGAIRALGGGLVAVYAVQVVLHLATAVLVATVGRRRFGAAVGLGAAALWLALDDPAYYTGRVLSCTLVGFTSALLLERLDAVPRRATRGALVSLGLALGVAALANPPMLVALPVAALWIARRVRATAALLVLGTGALAIAPATLHNVLASGEVIPISAQAGVTFAHGNSDGAEGVYRAAEGVATDRRQQNLDALALARAALGEDAGWGDADRWFLARGLAWWADHPLHALRLAASKAWWFASGRVYGDVYLPRLERADGIASRLVLAPLPVAWWVLPAFVALLLFARRVPEALVLLVPWAVVAAFWYSPRYRFPALPAVALLGAAGLAQLGAWRRAPRRVLALGLAFVLAAASGWIDASAGRDQPRTYAAEYELALGSVLARQGDLAGAEPHLRAALSLRHPSAPAALAELLRRAGRTEEAAELLRGSDDDTAALRTRAVLAAEAGRLEEARGLFERALARAPNDAQALAGRGNLQLALGDADGAVEWLERALECDPHLGEARYALAVAEEAAGRPERAEAHLRELLRDDPDMDRALRRLVASLKARGRPDEALELLRAAHARRPDDAALALVLAWDLATLPDPAPRDGAEAERIARELCAGTGAPDAEALDTWAAALAESGNPAAAAATAARAEETARRAGDAQLAAEIAARRELYARGEAYRQPPPGPLERGP